MAIENSVPTVFDLCSSIVLGFSINNRRTRIKIDRNSVFDCHISPLRRQMAIENNSISNCFDLRSSIVLAFSIAAYPVC